jgi:hypothetical protein
MSTSRVIIVFILILALGVNSLALSSPRIPSQTAHLGKVRFANSCNSEVQVELNSAVAMLHSFQYGLAEKTFSHVVQQDPQCAIAYWGAAMTLYHQLWDWPSAETLKKGQAYLKRGQTARKEAPTGTGVSQCRRSILPARTARLGGRSRVQAYSDAARTASAGTGTGCICRGMKESPARFNSLAGAARASRAVGDLGKARSYYEALVKCCSPRAARQEFGEARTFLGGN